MKTKKNIMNTKLIMIAMACMLMISSAQAQVDNTRVLSLDDVLFLAQEQSINALIAKQTFKSSDLSFLVYKADYLPSLRLAGTTPSYVREIESVKQNDGTFEFYGVDYAQARLDLSLTQRIRKTGGDISLQSGLYWIDNLSGSPLDQPFAANIIRMQYDQPIFQYNRYKWEGKVEPTKYEMAKRKYLEDIEQVSITAIDNFFNLLQAQVEMQIAEKNMSNYDTLYKIAKGRFQLGKIAENELLQLELNFLQSEATLQQAALDMDNRLFQLKSFLRLQDEIDVELLPPTVNDFFTIEAGKALTEAKYNSSTSLDFELRIIEAQRLVNEAKMNGRFDAELGASFGLASQGASIQGAYTHPDQSQVVELRFGVPIHDWGAARGRINIALSQEEIILLDVEQDKIDFEQSIFLEVVQFNMQQNQLRIAAKADTVAQKRYDVTEKRYKIGKINDVLELDKAQIDNDNALIGYYRALRTYWRSYFQVRKKTLYDFESNRQILFNIQDVM